MTRAMYDRGTTFESKAVRLSAPPTIIPGASMFFTNRCIAYPISCDGILLLEGVALRLHSAVKFLLAAIFCLSCEPVV